ncbi:DUF1566 domain-containing protein [Microbulbifer thermotolerans]|uniref:Lcl domain-containing protein n=1 Tax=Microbulbifer thermotolerans TaxID=252514 RepID=UPI0026727A83|nr:DUF1566 domain-containing protein [Microbulbifer thermotolerans]WKT60426.1 DUF1566 domain-containing protein [Microbulbifer thermotolerans]
MVFRNSFAVLLSVLTLTACGNGLEADTEQTASQEISDTPIEEPDLDPGEDPVEDPTEDPVTDPGDGDLPPPEPSSLIKLGSDGAPLEIQSVAWSDSGSEEEGSQWACVQDTISGLVWEVKRPNAQNDHSAANSFSWYNPDSETLNKASGLGQCYAGNTLTGGADCNTRAFAERIRALNLCGLTNWRIPSIAELATLLSEESDASSYHTGVAQFPGINGVAETTYWSSDAADHQYVWAMDFSQGEAVLREPYEALNLRLVSGNQAPVATSQRIAIAPDDLPIAPTSGEQKLDITLSGEDPDGDDLIYTLVTEPQHGALRGNPPQLEYILDHEYTGEDSFTFTVSDGSETSESATVTIGIAPLVSENPATPTPVDLAQFDTESPQPFLLKDSIADDGQALGYMEITVPENTDIMQDLSYFLAAQNIRSEQATHYTFELFTESDFSGTPLTQVTASDGALIAAANHKSKTLYLRLKASFDEAAPVYFELAGGSDSEPNRLVHYCEEYPHPELIPYNICNWESGWDIGCDDERCIAVNAAPEVDLKYECAYRTYGMFENVMRCHAFEVSTGEFSYEICPSPYICTKVKLDDPPDVDPGDTVPVTDPIEISFDTPSVTIEVPTTPAYGVNLTQQLFLKAVEGSASQQILSDFFETLRASLVEDAAADSTVAPWRDYVVSQLDSGASVSEIIANFTQDTASGNQEAAASLYATINELIVALTQRPQSALNNDEIWLLTITMAHINDRREALVTNAEHKVADYFAELSDCFGLHCVYVSTGFPQVLADAIATTDADLISAGAVGGVAVASGVGTYITLTSSVVLSTAMVHTAAAAAKAGVTVSAFISGSASIAALPAVIVTVGVVCTVVSVSNLIEAGENEAAYNAFLQENNARFNDLAEFIDTQHSDEVHAEITNAAIRMLDEMFP